MPSTATITTWYSFSPQTVIYSAYVNSNFNVFRGHLIPVDPTATSSPDNTYDLGAADHRWRYVYGKSWPTIQSTSGSVTVTNTHNVILMNTTAGTLTATLPTCVGFTGLSWTIKNIGTGGKSVYIDANGAETIDNTLTVNLVDYESATLISDGAALWII